VGERRDHLLVGGNALTREEALRIAASLRREP
jgi:hypothetical protein